MNIIFSPSVSDRLDVVISIDQSLSIAYTHYLISKRLVWVNGRYCRKNSVQVTPNDIITLIPKQRNLDPAVLSESPDIAIPIVFQHPDYLVIHKPKGVLTHPTTIKNTTFPSVTGFLYHYTRRYLPECHHFVRTSIVHRLDRDTDWLMIVALTEKWLFHFRALFTQKSDALTIQDKEAVPLTKTYHARVSRTSERQVWLESLTTPRYHTSPVSPKIPDILAKDWTHVLAKDWTTKLCGWYREGDDIILECEILTGRTHQIRYHCAEWWLPIKGDNLYNDACLDEDGKTIGLSAVSLSFVDPDGVMREWSIA